MKKSLFVQLRVINALMMREMHTIYGKSRLGYLWSLIHFTGYIATVWCVRSLCHMSMPHGLSILSFLVAGYTIWLTIDGGIMKCIKAIEANISLLTFPQVTPVDIMISRCLMILCSNLVSAIILISVGWFFGLEVYINNVGGLLFVLFVTYMITLGLGMIFSALNSYFSFIERLLPLVFRIILLASGVIFSVVSFSGRIGEWFLWNPFLQLIECTRSYMSLGYCADFVSHKYLLTLSLIILTLGLLLEKFTRKRLMK